MKNLKKFNEEYKYDKAGDMFPNDQFKSLSTADTILDSTYMTWKNANRERLWFDMVSSVLSATGAEFVSTIDQQGPEGKAAADTLLMIANHWAKDEKEGILKSIEKY